MRRDVIEMLVCPRSGQQLGLETLEADGDEIEHGILTSEAGEYALVSGIPVFIDVDGPLVDLLRAGRFADATALAAFGGLPRSRLQRLAGCVAQEAPGPLRTVLESVARRQVGRGRRAVFGEDGALDPAQVLRFAYLDSAGRSVDAYNYFSYRYSSPRHLVALSCIEAAPQGAGTVVDFGCGAGHLTWSLQAHLAPEPVLGVDKSFFLLLLARHAILPLGAFVCADGSALPIPSASCALVFASDVLSFVTDKWTVMRELDRVMTPDGCLMVTSVKNALHGHVYAGEPLSPRGWSRLVEHLHHRVVSDGAILERYLAGEGLPAPDALEPSAAAASKMLSVLATKGDASIECRERLGGWPHARGELAVNPLFRSDSEHAGRQRYVRRFPSQTYLDDNPEMAEYLPPDFSLPDGVLPGRGRTTDDALQGLIASLCVLGLPPGFPRSITTG